MNKMNRIKRVLNVALFGVICLSFIACPGILIPDGMTYDIDEAEFEEAAGLAGSARIYYPVGIQTMNGTFDATTVCGGMTNTKEQMYWLAEYLQENGDMIVIAFGVKANITNGNYEKGHKGSVSLLNSENANPDSPIHGKVGKIAVMGYSMGGAGALQAADDLGDEVDAVVGLAPFAAQGDLNGIAGPALCIVGTADVVANPIMVRNAFDKLPEDIPRIYAQIEGVGHFYWVNNSDATVANPYILAFLKYYLSGDSSYYIALYNPPSGIVDDTYQFIE